MFSLVYASRALFPFDLDSLSELAQQSLTRNKALDITGYFYFGEDCFFQYLEGDKSRVLSLLSSIEQDERHKIVTTLYLKSSPERLFSDWNMQLLDKKDIDAMSLELSLQDVMLNMINKLLNQDRAIPFVKGIVQEISEKQYCVHRVR